MKTNDKTRFWRRLALVIAVVGAAALWIRSGKAQPADKPTTGPAAAKKLPLPGPLPRLKPMKPALVELGKMLFFDKRMSGDFSISCATCHDPKKGWGDGAPLSKAYPGSKHFRNAKTLLNSAHARYFHWDGRLSGKDLPTLVRDQITETHFLNMDGRLLLERLKQVPDYVKRFKATLGGEPSFGRILKAVAAFLRTIVSKNVPFDRGALSAAARRGYALFKGKAGCLQCHNGPYFSDGKAHATGVATNPDIINDPMRHITMRSYFKFMGVVNFENARTDVGYFAVSKQNKDRGKFLTPTLREVSRTGPYMHNGVLKTLAAVIDFYDAGGGKAANKSPLLKPLGLTAGDKKDLKAFLDSLSGREIIVKPPKLQDYKVFKNWLKTPN